MRAKRNPNKTYSQLTSVEKGRILQAFDGASFYATDVRHAVAIAAHNGLQLTNREWNSKRGADSFAAALAALVMAGRIALK